MFSRKTGHRIHVEEMQPRLGNGPRANDVYSRAERGRNAEQIAWTFEHFKDLFPPLGIHAKAFHATRFENAEAPTLVSFHKNQMAG
jgi:hypothetical protein